MKKVSLSKQLLLAGSVLAVSFACQSKQSESYPPQHPKQELDECHPCKEKKPEPKPCKSEPKPCESKCEIMDQAAPAPEVPAAQIETPSASEAPASAKAGTPPAPVEPVAGKAPAAAGKAPAVPANPEVKVENSAPKLAPVNAVSENRAPTTSASTQN